MAKREKTTNTILTVFFTILSLAWVYPMIAGLEDISSGELYIDGKLMNDVPPKDRDIAMVFQSYALYPHMTVYENMDWGTLTACETAKDPHGIDAVFDLGGPGKEPMHRTFSPPESALGLRSRYSVMPSISAASRTFLSISSLGSFFSFREKAMG